jgi:oligopeptide transport system ATP-binding protein
MTFPLLSIKNLAISFPRSEGNFCAAKNINLSLEKGEILGLVGQSGCGKSTIAETILFSQKKIVTGEILFQGIDLLTKSNQEMQLIRGKRIGMIFQDPLTSLNPTIPIGQQIQEMIHQHERLSRREEHERILELLNLVGIADPALRITQFPFQFSGGMRQRIMIAIAMACHPELIVADEPTTSLDVTIQAQILTLLKGLCRQNGSSLLFITHDMGVVAGICDKVAVMNAGEIVEVGSVEQIFYNPQHPYTKLLISLAK